MADKQSELRSPEGAGRREELTAEVKELASQLESLETNLNELSTNVDISFFLSDGTNKLEKSWDKEIRELLDPLIEEVKDLTSLPREIDRLEKEVSEYEQKLAVIEKAVSNLRTLQEEKLSDEEGVAQLNKWLSVLLDQWDARRQKATAKLSVAKQKLQQKLAEKKPLSATMQNIFQVFFRSRGRNLLLAFLATVLFWVLLRRLHRGIIKVSPIHQRREGSFTVRFFNGVLSRFYGCWGYF